MRTQGTMLVIVTAGLALACGGCALIWVGGGAAVGAGAVAYIRGEVKATEEAPLTKVWDATGKAIQDLELKTISQDKDAMTARLVARTAADKKVEVNLQRVTDKLTEVRIRVGTLGDESLSRLILRNIEKRL